MAVIGEELLQPESGWKRYDAIFYPIFNNLFKYGDISKWVIATDTVYRAQMSSTGVAGSINFKFKGTKLRIISLRNTNRHSVINVNIDGAIYTYNAVGSIIYKCLNFEISELEDTVHEVTIENVPEVAKYFDLVAIDIDENGRLLHPILEEVYDIDNIDIGKCIRCHYSATYNELGIFNNLGKETSECINQVTSTDIPDGDFYFVCVGYDHIGRKKLIADRVIQNSINYDIINKYGLVSGNVIKINDITDNLIPIMISNIQTKNGEPGEVVDSGNNYKNLQGWRALDDLFINDNDVWYAEVGQVGYLGFDFKEPVIVNRYCIETYIKYTHHPKDFTFEGWDGYKWVVLHTVTDSGMISNKSYFYEFDNNKAYTKYRVNITSSYSGTALNMKRLKMYRVTESNIKDIEFTARLLSGGLNSSDKNNEWDKILVEWNLNGLINEGGNLIWNCNNVWSWTSSTVKDITTRRIARGYQDISAIDTIKESNYNATNIGFRPILLAENVDSLPDINNINISDTNPWYSDSDFITITSDITDFEGNSVKYKIIVNGQDVITSETLQTPYSMNQQISKDLFDIGDNILEIKVFNYNGDKYNTFRYIITKENIDDYTFKRIFDFDEYTKSDNINIVYDKGIVLESVGEGEVIVQIPTEGKSKIQSILVNNDDDFVGPLDIHTSMTQIGTQGEGKIYEVQIVTGYKDINTIMIKE